MKDSERKWIASSAQHAAEQAVESVAETWKGQEVYLNETVAVVTPREPEPRTFVVTRKRVWAFETAEVKP